MVAELITDIAGADAAMAELDGSAAIGIDIETASPDARPEAVRINTDGALSAIQPRSTGDGLDPHRAGIMTIQLYGGDDKAFVFRGAALTHVLHSRWLREQQLVAHNAAFEIGFLRHHTTPPGGVKARHPVECTLQAAGLLFGCWNRSLAASCQNVLGIEPPKSLQVSCWSAPRLSPGQVAYAAADAVLAHRLWLKMRPTLEAKGRFAAYELQRDSVLAVADMQLRGLGFDRETHAQQAEAGPGSWPRRVASISSLPARRRRRARPRSDHGCTRWPPIALRPGREARPASCRSSASI